MESKTLKNAIKFGSELKDYSDSKDILFDKLVHIATVKQIDTPDGFVGSYIHFVWNKEALKYKPKHLRHNSFIASFVTVLDYLQYVRQHNRVTHIYNDVNRIIFGFKYIQ